jgi:A/G-specific adenine glycosylase
MVDFAARVAAWQKRHGRHDLPWQRTRDAYRIWLSEVMLQQTQVATVLPYYERFVARFPDLATLASAPLDEVLALWSGLGYYSRARNLHRAAQAIAAQHAGRFPRDFEAVLALPGVGRSTAAAICVFAYGARHAILDGNVKRLFARCFGIGGTSGDATTLAQLWATADEVLPKAQIEAYTQGLMDLGAAVCTRGSPRCCDCPVSRDCVARATGRISELPAPRRRQRLPQRRTAMVVLVHAGEVMLEKRVASGIWGGLWSLPELEPGADIAAVCARRYGAEVAALEPMPAFAHTFTHFRLDIEPHKAAVARVVPHASAPGVVWLPLDEAIGAAIPAPVRRILNALNDSVTQ